MKILTDTHTHTTASAHAYSTLMENVIAAKEKGLELLAMTNHCPMMEDAPHIWHFEYMKILPPVIDGVKMLYGAELNIINQKGEVDLPERVLKNLGIVIASIHTPVYEDRDEKDHTKTWLSVMENPYVDVLGHTGRNGYLFDHDTVIKTAKEKDICIEVNRYTISNEKFREACREIILCCKKHGAKMVVGSDAHFCSDVGNFEDAISFLKECDFPEELVVNKTAVDLINHLKNKKKYFNYKF